MRSISSGGQLALDSGVIRRRNAVYFYVGAGYGFWDDVYDLTAGGLTYAGRAGRFTMTALPSVSDGRVQGLNIDFSAIDSEVYTWMQSTAWHQKPVVAKLILLDPVTNAVIDALPWFAGTIDQALLREKPDGTTALRVMCESTSRELDRRGSQSRSEASQRRLASDDGFFKHTALAGQVEIYWGRKGPKAVPGEGGGGGGGNWVGGPGSSGS